MIRVILKFLLPVRCTSDALSEYSETGRSSYLEFYRVIEASTVPQIGMIYERMSDEDKETFSCIVSVVKNISDNKDQTQVIAWVVPILDIFPDDILDFENDEEVENLRKQLMELGWFYRGRRGFVTPEFYAGEFARDVDRAKKIEQNQFFT